MEGIDIKQEDQGDKIEMLRKIEHHLDFLSEARDYIHKIKRKELEAEETKQHGERRGERLMKKKNIELGIINER